MAVNKRGIVFNVAVFLLLPVITHFSASAQEQDSLQINRKRLNTFVIGSAAGYGIALAGLNYLWYKDTEQQPFRFFNDNAEWKQVDKLGHFYSAFYLSYGTSAALRWCNVPAKKADVWGALTGFLVLVPIEVFDGFSEAYGASSGDLLADAAGPAFFIGQKMLWDEVRLVPKFSFRRTGYAALRPALLGDGIASEILKDYNGQTYWLSADMDKFMPFPKWLNLAAGYGAQGMVYARDAQNRSAGYQAYRQYYLGLDLDLTAVRTRSKALKTLLFIASCIRLPAPAIEFSRKKLTFRPLQF